MIFENYKLTLKIIKMNSRNWAKMTNDKEEGKVVFKNVIAKLGDIDNISYDDIFGIIVNSKHYKDHVDETQVNNLAMTYSFKHIPRTTGQGFSFKVHKTYDKVEYRKQKTTNSLSKCLIYMFSFLYYTSGDKIEKLQTCI